ncbi:hypothetical protein [Nitrosopumilus sp.]|uniref:hypothetical protein n=1 Tax=Nitrosopumilus sp. TaxID=2024843 RepID=UPI003D0A1694
MVILSGYEQWLRNGKKYKNTEGMTDGVDYIRFSLKSEKGAPYADFEPCDGSIKINLDEIYNEVKYNEYSNPEGVLIAKIIDVIGHELSHKWFQWGMAEELDSWTSGTFNEMDERIMRVIVDWIVFDKKKKGEMYDWS